MATQAIPPDEERIPLPQEIPWARTNGHDIDRLLGVKSKPEPAYMESYDLQTADQIAARPPSRYRIKNLLLAEGVACVFGPSGSGKSFLAMDMGIAISDGLNWFNKRVSPADVVWICLEGLGGLERRIKAIKQHYGERAGERMRFLVEPFVLSNEDDVDRLILSVERYEMERGVIVLDTLNASTPGMDENSSKDMGTAIAAAKRIQAKCGGLVLLVHHSGKDISKGLRGHSSLHGALDTLIEVDRQEDRRTWTLKKSKDGADGEQHEFMLKIVTLGEDEDGEAITSCVISHDMQSAGPVSHRPLPPKAGNQRIIWDALGELFRDSHHYGKAAAPASRPCLEIEPAIDRIRTRLPVEPRRQTERARSSVKSLISSGLLCLADGWLWIP